MKFRLSVGGSGPIQQWSELSADSRRMCAAVDQREFTVNDFKLDCFDLLAKYTVESGALRRTDASVEKRFHDCSLLELFWLLLVKFELRTNQVVMPESKI
jgi:hypothetical protein